MKPYYQKEVFVQLLRVFFFSRPLSKDTRYVLQLFGQRLAGSAFKSKLKNYCVVTGHSRAVLRLFKISRMTFKNLADRGLLPGVKKASW